MMKIQKPPAGLKSAGKKFWKHVLKDFEFTESHDLERLRQACGCVDSILEAEEVVEAEGRFIRDRFQQIKEHPACRAIRDNKVLFCRIIRELGLDISTPGDSRPPRQY